ncbi:MAG: hypothetical protein EBY17_15000 [Acidobacteriia bacterium]|jgi:putative sigma-54 modulation protein|nr:hypothetical protein [Terriglobia bacterium]
MNQHKPSHEPVVPDPIQLKLTTHGVEMPGELKDYIQRRVQAGLGRFASRIRAISVRFVDVNGPRGGQDKCCDVRVDAGLTQEVFIREQHGSMFAAFCIAMLRAERSLRRQLQASRDGISRRYRAGSHFLRSSRKKPGGV